MPTRARDVHASVLGALGLANLLSAAFVFFFFTFLARTASPIGWDRDDIISGAAFIAYMTTASTLAVVFALRSMRRPTAWLNDRRPPADGEVARLLGLPATMAQQSFAYWVGAGVLFGGLNLAFGNAVAYSARITVGTLMGGLTASALVYLLVERRLRPVFAVALADRQPPATTMLSISWRLVLAWILGSGIPLLGIALAPFGRVSDSELSVAPIVGLAVGGLIAGGYLVAAAARSVAGPLEQLRAATSRVQSGDLSTTVAVDDGGEIGLLQAGFNSMVQGLDEQERLRELFGHYVGDDVARAAMERGVGLGGELRHVSVLFVDLIGSTALTEQRPPADVVVVLNRFFAAVVREVGREGGWVNKFAGDGALCAFGAPADQPDHAVRASRAARQLHDALSDHQGVDAAIGVSAGLVVAGNIGAEQRYEYTVIGEAVNEASRLCELAKNRSSRVLAGDAVITAAGPAEAAAWRKVGTFELRGRLRPATVYEPAGANDASALVARSTPSSSTP